MNETNLINSTFRKNLSAQQLNLASQIALEEPIAKILCVDASSRVDFYEALKGEIKLNGQVCFNVLCRTETNELVTLKSQENFSTKIEDDSIQPNTAILFKTDIIEFKSDLSSDEIKLNCALEISPQALITETVNNFSTQDNSIILNTNTVSFLSLKSKGKVDFNFEESFKTTDDVEKILLSKANVQVNNYSLGTGYFTIEGQVVLNVFYLLNSDKKELKNFVKCYKFKEELEVEDISKDGELNLQAVVNNCQLVTNINSDENEKTISFSVPIEVNYAYCTKNESEIAVDAYSLTDKLNLNIESFKISNKNENILLEEKIDGQVLLDENAPRILKLFGYGGENVSLTNVFVDNENLVIEGLASVVVVYSQENFDEQEDVEEFNSVVAELPFSLNFSQSDFNGDVLFANALIKDIDIKIRKGREILIDMDISFAINSSNFVEEMALTNATISEPLSPREACLQIYFAKKGNTIWEISKGLITRPEIILEQNPEINLPLEDDTKIILYNPKRNS